MSLPGHALVRTVIMLHNLYEMPPCRKFYLEQQEDRRKGEDEHDLHIKAAGSRTPIPGDSVYTTTI